MRLGLFGGSFDPPHHGHLLAASDAFEALGLDAVVWIPAAQQPLKLGRVAASAGDRLAMVAAAVEGDPRFRVDALEVERAGVSFTVDTVEAYRQRHPEAALFLLLGADVVATFARWRSPARIAALARVVILQRAVEGGPADPAGVAGAMRAVTGAAAGEPVVLPTRRVDISSTEIRERVRGQRSLHGFVPDRVARVIHERALYR